MLIINLKTYSGNLYNKLFPVLEEIESMQNDDEIIRKNLFIAPNMAELGLLRNKFPNINLISQNVNAVEMSKQTGHVPAKLLQEIGIKHTLFNHSESKHMVKNLIDELGFINHAGNNAVVCVESIDEAKSIINLKPFAVAYEPPELIGSNISVSTQKPDIIKEFVSIIDNYSIPIIGAGITGPKDIEIGKSLGVKGFIVARAFNDSVNKIAFIKSLLEPYR